MLKLRDLYTQISTYDIDVGEKVGTTIIQYEVHAYTDLRNLTCTKSYVVTCAQRFVVPNDTFRMKIPLSTVTSFTGYPAALSASISIAASSSDSIENLLLIDYTPRTLNSAVNTNQSTAASSSSSNSQQYTSGSSTSQTNSHSWSVSGGFFGDAPTGSIGYSKDHSKTKESSTSQSTGSSVETGDQFSNSDSMSIKDWGCYASVDADYQSPTWVWGQEYPWNVLQFRNPSSDAIVLPTFVQSRLYDGTQLYPPSDLSMFGFDVVARAAWLLTPSPGSAVAETFVFTHKIQYTAGTHKLVGDPGSYTLQANLNTYPQTQTITSDTLDLPVLALDPIRGQDTSAALVGFVPNQFDVAPTASGGNFQITAEANNLLVRGSGFTGIMTTNFTTGTVTLTISFKIIDSMSTISLSMKHWMTTSTAVQIGLVINGDTTLSRFFDSPEGGTGGDNVTVITLRNRDFTSVDYCDYLQKGLNQIVVTITPVTASATNGYELMALAVG